MKKICILVITFLLFMTYSCRKKELVVFNDLSIGLKIGESYQLPEIKNVHYEYSMDEEAFLKEGLSVTALKEGSLKVKAYNKKNVFLEEISLICNDGKIEKLDTKTPLIQFNGRVQDSSEGVKCYNCCTGITVKFYGTRLACKMLSAGSETAEMCILLDGEKDPRKNILTLTKNYACKDYTIVEGLTEGVHTVELYKSTEPTFNDIIIASVMTDGYFKGVKKDKRLKVEVLGCSIECGYMNLRDDFGYEPPDNKRDLLSNCCASWCFLSALDLNLNMRVHAKSGMGVYSNWGSGQNMIKNWRDLYLHDVDYLTLDSNPVYNSQDFIPDMVIIDLGVNDYWYDWDEDNYYASMKRLVSSVLSYYGEDTKIILVEGIMDSVCDTLPVVEYFKNKGHKIYCFDQVDGYYSAHPLLEDHEDIKDLFVTFFKNLK